MLTARCGAGVGTLLRTSLPLVLACGALLAWVVMVYLENARLLGDASLVASDPPAHFVSGVLVYDYLWTAFGSNPLHFAESFYVRYPKVAIGHWPPVYYAVQAVWYGLFGTSPGVARALSAAVAAALAGLLFLRLRRGPSVSLAFAAAWAFLALPWVQRTALEVMSDLLTGLFTFLALLAFADLLDGRGKRAGGRFLVWSALAVLTKGTAVALGPFVLAAPLLAGRARCYRAPWYWGGGLGLAAIGALFFLGAQVAGLAYPVTLGSLLRQMMSGKIAGAAVVAWWGSAPWPVFTLALVGFLDAAWARWRNRDQAPCTTDALVAAAFVFAQGGFLLLSNLTHEPRAFLPSLAPLVVLAVRAVAALGRFLPVRVAATASVLALSLAVVSGGRTPLNRVDGYATAAAAIPYPDSGTLIVIGSDPPGEGAFIVERLVHDDRRAGVVLRGTSLLAESDWMGTRSTLRFESPGQVRDWLLAQPVSHVVIDDSAKLGPDLQLLKDAVAGGTDFRLAGRYPVTDRLGVRQGELWIYENPAAAGRHPTMVRVRLGLDRSGRVLEYLWP